MLLEWSDRTAPPVVVQLRHSLQVMLVGKSIDSFFLSFRKEGDDDDNYAAALSMMRYRHRRISCSMDYDLLRFLSSTATWRHNRNPQRAVSLKSLPFHSTNETWCTASLACTDDAAVS